MLRTSLMALICALACTPTPDTSAPKAPPPQPPQEKTAPPQASPDKAQEVVASIDLAQLKADGKLDSLKIRDAKPRSEPFYKRDGLMFRGYELAEVLALNERFAEVDAARHSLRFVCVDGYRTTFAFSSIKGATGVVAIGMVTKGGLDWPMTSRGKTQEHAGPYYLVWDQEDYDKERPWPYQLTRIELVSNEVMSAGVAPPKGSDVEVGYTLFKTHCLACHSVNLKGGKMGPELNVPKNILSYRDRAQLIEFVKSPQSFRAGSTMPPMMIPDESLSAIFDYLAVMAKHPVCRTTESCAAIAAQRP